MSTSERVQLWAMRGLTAAEITHQTKLPRSTVKYHLKRFKETGSWTRREYPIRVKTLTPFAECIRKHLKLHPHASATELHELLATKFQLMVSVRTVQRYLKSAGREAKGMAQDNSGEESDTSTTEELSVASGGEQSPHVKVRSIERTIVTSHTVPQSSELDTKTVDKRRNRAEVHASTVSLSSGPGASISATMGSMTARSSISSSGSKAKGLDGPSSQNLHAASQSSHHLSSATFSASSNASQSLTSSTYMSAMIHPHLTPQGMAIGQPFGAAQVGPQSHAVHQNSAAAAAASASSSSASGAGLHHRQGLHQAHHPPVLPHLPFGLLPQYPMLLSPTSMPWSPHAGEFVSPQQQASPSSPPGLHQHMIGNGTPKAHMSQGGTAAHAPAAAGVPVAVPAHSTNTAAAPPLSALPLMNASPVPPLPLGLFPLYPHFNTHNASDARPHPLSAHAQTNSPSFGQLAAATASPVYPKVEPSLEALINAALVSD